MAVVGPYNSECAQIEVPIAQPRSRRAARHRQPVDHVPEPHARRSSWRCRPYGFRGEPDVYYPTGEHNFLRLAARGDLNGVALAELARTSAASQRVPAERRTTASATCCSPTGSSAPPRAWASASPGSSAGEPGGYAELAERVAKSGADGVLLGTFLEGGAAEALR